MKKLTTLLDLAKINNIIVVYEDINNIANGICVIENQKYYVIIDENITNDLILFKEVLAEEIGHCFTIIDDPTPRKNQNYTRK